MLMFDIVAYEVPYEGHVLCEFGYINAENRHAGDDDANVGFEYEIETEHNGTHVDGAAACAEENGTCGKAVYKRCDQSTFCWGGCAGEGGAYEDVYRRITDVFAAESTAAKTSCD
jgi:hypothetical protein